MNLTLTNQSHWQEMMQRQARINAERWIDQLESSDERLPIAIEEYDNILRALEYTLRSEELFNLTYQIINLLFPAIYNFADWDRWLVYLNDALMQSQSLAIQLAEASLSEKLGDLHRSRSEYAKTDFHYTHSKKLYKSLGELSHYANILSKLGSLNSSLGKPKLGLNMCLEALKISQSLNDISGEAMTELNLSGAYFSFKDMESSLKSATRSYQLYKEINKSDYAARALNNMFIAWFYLGMWEEIDDKAEDLLHELIEIGNVHILGKLKLNLGFFAVKRNNFIVAEKYYQEALHLAVQNQIPQDIALIYNNLGIAYTQMAEWESGEEVLMKAISLYKELKDDYNWANSMDNLALLFEAQGNSTASKLILSEVLTTSFQDEKQPYFENLLQEMRKRLTNITPSDNESLNRK